MPSFVGHMHYLCSHLQQRHAQLLASKSKNLCTTYCYIFQTKQHVPEGQMLFCLENVLPAATSTTTPSILFCVILVQRFGLGNKDV